MKDISSESGKDCVIQSVYIKRKSHWYITAENQKQLENFECSPIKQKDRKEFVTFEEKFEKQMLLDLVVFF